MIPVPLLQRLTPKKTSKSTRRWRQPFIIISVPRRCRDLAGRQSAAQIPAGSDLNPGQIAPGCRPFLRVGATHVWLYPNEVMEQDWPAGIRTQQPILSRFSCGLARSTNYIQKVVYNRDSRKGCRSFSGTNPMGLLIMLHGPKVARCRAGRQRMLARASIHPSEPQTRIHYSTRVDAAYLIAAMALKWWSWLR